jgi:hypothetical protein
VDQHLPFLVFLIVVGDHQRSSVHRLLASEHNISLQDKSYDAVLIVAIGHVAKDIRTPPWHDSVSLSYSFSALSCLPTYLNIFTRFKVSVKPLSFLLTPSSLQTMNPSYRADELRKDLVFMWRSLPFRRSHLSLAIFLLPTTRTTRSSFLRIASFSPLVSHCAHFLALNYSNNELLPLTPPSPPFTPASLHFTLGFIHTARPYLLPSIL